MRIDELDEWQGVTPQLVTDWLLSHGWSPKPTQPNWWIKGDDGFLFDALTFDQVWFWAYALAAIYANGNVQALLREINPREREGVPSEAARIAHPGNWMVSGSLNPSGEKHFEVWSAKNLPLASSYPYNPDGKRIACWPLDQNGNKLRWPTDANGAML